ncbi:glycine hydroxymethyltransferase [Mycoplasmoides fastidiosum]|uniref:Serine hydroxymethyltransferase n=1 Tax=Mycoplasmoides fastidiosum TaxID=92758 RepID=A0ABU0LYM6_9BACT|nr:serine hydroxymethyltransferase [Mycoplasmoides fastidiosum]MDQ0513718.1 glycine hydroxymethyltransferase [Mycoplasmoides fastidiosum]UUD37859.1 serine hydroxymethyltransferase [Mycoplasmoides fastidiosum]
MDSKNQARLNQINELLKLEEQRQNEHIELIASENFVSADVLRLTGSILTNKYAEGYPGARYYGGCEYIDGIESMAIDLVKEMFDCRFANVQPHAGTPANFAVYLALVPAGGKVMGMDINAGGHLSHGTKVSFSGKLYECVAYGVDPETLLLDYDAIEAQALAEKPNMIIAGASNYSRVIDFERFKAIAEKVGAFLLADVSHIAGLIVGGQHPNCFPWCDVMMTTTHKTLRGPRGAILAWNNPKLSRKINSAVFPGTQGGPLEHVIGAKAVAFCEALSPEFKEYAQKIVTNAKAFCQWFLDKGVKVLTNGTDNHLFTLNILDSYGITADHVEKWLESANITTNKNTIPFDTQTPQKPSGLRLGVAAMTTKGFDEKDFVQVAEWIDQIIRSQGAEEVIGTVKQKVLNLLNLKGQLN